MYPRSPRVKTSTAGKKHALHILIERCFHLYLSSCHVHSQRLPLTLKPIASIIARWPSSGNSLFLKFSLLPPRLKAANRGQHVGEGSNKRLDLRCGLTRSYCRRNALFSTTESRRQEGSKHNTAHNLHVLVGPSVRRTVAVLPRLAGQTHLVVIRR